MDRSRRWWERGEREREICLEKRVKEEAPLPAAGSRKLFLPQGKTKERAWFMKGRVLGGGGVVEGERWYSGKIKEKKRVSINIDET